MKSIKVFDVRTGLSFITESIKDASLKTGAPVASIHKILQGKSKKSNNYFFTDDLTMEKIPVVLPSNFRPKVSPTNRVKELRASKASKEEVKRELQSYPRVKTEELKHLVEKVTVVDGKNVLYIKPTIDQWTYDE